VPKPVSVRKVLYMGNPYEKVNKSPMKKDKAGMAYDICRELGNSALECHRQRRYSLYLFLELLVFNQNFTHLICGL